MKRKPTSPFEIDFNDLDLKKTLAALGEFSTSPANATKAELHHLAYAMWAAIMDNRKPGVTGPVTEGECLRTINALSAALNGGEPLDKLSRGLATLVDVPDGQIWTIAMLKWVDSGFPQITMSHKFCAALMVSEATRDVVEEVRHPWPGFIIEVPDGLLSLAGSTDYGDGKEVKIRRIFVTQIDNPNGEWAYIASGPSISGATLWRFGMKASQLLAPVESVDMFMEHAGSVEVTDVDMRANNLIGRLIIGSCAALTMNDMVAKPGKGHDVYARGGVSAIGREEIVREFKVGKPIVVDFREHVRNYLHGTGHKIEARTCVHGHFKQQHHGPGNTLVKRMYIEPYWRGPETAPIVVRPHVIGGDDAE